MPERHLWLLVGVAVLLAMAALLCCARSWIRLQRMLPALALLLAAWVCMSMIAHGTALSALGPATYITAGRGTAYWGLGLLLRTGSLYLLLGLLMVVFAGYFQWAEKPLRSLSILPAVFLPSLLVALYQSYGKVGFLNPFVRVWHGRAPGLGSDVNGFAVSMVFVFPLAWMALRQASDRLQKVVNGLVLVLIPWCVLLVGSRTAFAGIVLVALGFPLAYRPARTEKLSLARRWGPAGVAVLLSGLLLAVVLSSGTRISRQLPLLDRLRQSYQMLRSGDNPRRLSSRIELGLQALRLVKAAPLAGWGPGGFWRNLDNIRVRHGEKPGYVDNAENLYLQLGAELGIPGLAVVLGLFFLPLWALKGAWSRISVSEERPTVFLAAWTLLVTAGLCFTGPHLLLPDVLWLFCIFGGYVYAAAGCAVPPAPVRRHRAFFAAAALVMSLLFAAGTYATAFGTQGYRATRQAAWWPLKGEYGLYFPYEDWGPPTGEMVWTAENAAIHVFMKKNVLAFKVAVNPASLKNGQPLHLKIRVDGRVVGQLDFSRPQVRLLAYDLPLLKNRRVLLQIDVSHTFVPRRQGMGNDTRRLGVALGPFSFYDHLPARGTGFAFKRAAKATDSRQPGIRGQRKENWL